MNDDAGKAILWLHEMEQAIINSPDTTQWDMDTIKYLRSLCGDQIRLSDTAAVKAAVIPQKALAEFVSKYPTWWYTIGICDLTRDFTCAPQSHSPEAKYIQSGNEFDGGFSCDHYGTIDDAIYDVMAQIDEALRAIAKGDGECQPAKEHPCCFQDEELKS